MTVKRKCSKETRTFCKTLQDSLNNQNCRGRGMSSVEVLNFVTGDTSLIGVVYKSSTKDRGVMLNCCPWCSVPVLWVNEEPPVKSAGKPIEHETSPDVDRTIIEIERSEGF